MRRSILAVSAFAITMGAFGQTNTTVTSAKKSTLDKIKENTTLGYFSEYSGGNFKDISNTQEVNSNLWNSIKAKYRVNKATQAFIAHTFVLNQYDESNEGEEVDRYTSEDFRVGIEQWSKYNKDISFRNRVRLETPSRSAGEVAAHKTFRLRASHLATTTIGRLSLTGLGTFMKWVYNQEELNTDQSQYTLIPTAVAEYAISDKVSAYAEFSHFFNQREDENIGFVENGGQEFYLGTNISIASAFNLGVFAYISGDANKGMNISEDTSLKIQFSGAIF